MRRVIPLVTLGTLVVSLTAVVAQEPRQRDPLRTVIGLAVKSGPVPMNELVSSSSKVHLYDLHRDKPVPLMIASSEATLSVKDFLDIRTMGRKEKLYALRSDIFVSAESLPEANLVKSQIWKTGMLSLNLAAKSQHKFADLIDGLSPEDWERLLPKQGQKTAAEIVWLTPEKASWNLSQKTKLLEALKLLVRSQPAPTLLTPRTSWMEYPVGNKVGLEDARFLRQDERVAIVAGPIESDRQPSKDEIAVWFEYPREVPRRSGNGHYQFIVNTKERKVVRSALYELPYAQPRPVALTLQQLKVGPSAVPQAPERQASMRQFCDLLATAYGKPAVAICSQEVAIDLGQDQKLSWANLQRVARLYQSQRGTIIAVIP